jgi:cytochrome c oxidase subunit 2
MWHAEHPAGEREINELHVPLDRPVELVMTSQDVIHSLSIPGFRIKQDVLPGRYTTLSFTANRPGEYRLYCTQFCGTSHSNMVGRVVVMEPAAYEGWLAAHANVPTMASRGERRYHELGCDGCHGALAAVHAPKLEGLFGKPVPLRDGRTVLADERFIRDAVLLPNEDVPAGYEASMPSFRGQISEEELLEIIEYVKSKGNATQEVVP